MNRPEKFPRYALASCAERVQKAVRGDGLRRQHLNQSEWDIHLFHHPDAQELDLHDAAYLLTPEDPDR